jgi:hypothetical protein
MGPFVAKAAREVKLVIDLLISILRPRSQFRNILGLSGDVKLLV